MITEMWNGLKKCSHIHDEALPNTVNNNGHLNPKFCMASDVSSREVETAQYILQTFLLWQEYDYFLRQTEWVHDWLV